MSPDRVGSDPRPPAPRTADPLTADPRRADRPAAHPRAADSRAADSRAADPRAADRGTRARPGRSAAGGSRHGAQDLAVGNGRDRRAEAQARVDRLLTAANRLATTIATTEAITQRRADILQGPRIISGGAIDGRDRRQGIVSLSEAARRTGRHPEVLRRWCTEGRIPAIRVGRTWAIGPDTLAELMAHSGRSRPRLAKPNSP